MGPALLRRPHDSHGPLQPAHPVHPVHPVKNAITKKPRARAVEALRTAGVQQAHKDARITFTALTPWPGELVAAEGGYICYGSSSSARE